MLRIYADFNSVSGTREQTLCWCLRYGTPLRPLDDVATDLDLHDGMSVILYYEDDAEEFEVSAILEEDPGSTIRWQARVDWKTLRRIRG